MHCPKEVKEDRTLADTCRLRPKSTQKYLNIDR
jgi:hypothetical protein